MDLRESQKRSEIKRHPWELARTDVVMDLMTPLLKPRNVFLDVGCGDVYFLNEVFQRVPQSVCYALDPAFSPEHLTALKQQLSGKAISVFDSESELINSLQQKVDFVFLMDVLEHIEADEAFLAQLVNQPFITDDTIFIVTVPAYQSLWTSHDVFLGHYRRYSNAVLKYKIALPELNVISCGYFFAALLVPRFLQVIKEKIFPPKHATTGLVEWQGGIFITAIIKNILFTDYKMGRLLKFLGLNLPGLSNYVLCRKRAS